MGEEICGIWNVETYVFLDTYIIVLGEASNAVGCVPD